MQAAQELCQSENIARITEQRMSYYLPVVVILLALWQQLQAVSPEGYRHDSGQYLYMERLRRATRTIAENDDAGEISVNPGTLLATSFKDTSKFIL